MKPRIVVVGSSNTDMIIKVDHLPLPGETILGKGFHIVHGGKGANQAVAAARAGGQVTFICCIGDDSFGKNSLEFYRKEGIDINRIKIVRDVPSGVAMINVADSGENSISVAPGANSHLLPEDIEKNREAILSADVVLMQLEIPVKTVYKTLEIAREKNIPVILNPAPAPLEQLDPGYLKLVKLITPNENEAAKIAAVPETIGSPELIKELQNLGINSIIITLGKSGVLFSENGQQKHQEGQKVEAVDTTAAGDTFNGYLAVSVARGESLDKAVQLANKAAALSVTRLGASSSIPFIGEIS